MIAMRFGAALAFVLAAASSAAAFEVSSSSVSDGKWDKKPENYLGFLHFACALIALRAAGLFG